MKYLINGNFFCSKPDGIKRFSYEICKALDKICEKDLIGIYVPANAENVLEFTNIKIINSSKKLNSFYKWDLFTFKSACKKHKCIPLNLNCSMHFNNKGGIVFIHDIYEKLYPKDFITFKEKIKKTYMCNMYSRATKKAEKIFTVSEYSKKQIIENYNVKPEKIFLLFNGWEHFKSVKPDASIFKSFPLLQKGNFYFALGNLQKRKNLKWIIEYAKKNPEEQFAISYKPSAQNDNTELNELNELPNVILLGYVSDDSVKALMQNCKAFVFPSYYEGFGIPPLEALSVGARVIISNAASLPEIYKKSAYYIDPQNPNVSLSKLLLKPVEPADKILKEYTYKNAAKLLYEQLSQK